jgi:uncharacterized membrane protein YgaE (UPF0421/DUF939 family)
MTSGEIAMVIIGGLLAGIVSFIVIEWDNRMMDRYRKEEDE